MPAPMRRGLLAAIISAVLLAGAAPGWGQGPRPVPPAPLDAPDLALPSLVPGPPPAAPLSLLPPLTNKDGTADPVPVLSNTSFIDSANCWNIVRLRFDAAYDINRPTRSEYILTATGPFTRGLPQLEKQIDYQDIDVYAEYVLLPQLSLFIEVPERFLNPVNNKDQCGPGDMTVGGKLLGIQTPSFTGTGEVMAILPTGNSRLGLGDSHVRLQGGLLGNWRPNNLLVVEGSIQAWVPLDDTRYGGEMILYGLGFSYANPSLEAFWITPVVEFTGWTCVRGAEQFVYSSSHFVKHPSEGDTIINGNFGVRGGIGPKVDLYLGMSRMLSGERWWTNLYRLELRWRY
jgi:hypothetical protein